MRSLSLTRSLAIAGAIAVAMGMFAANDTSAAVLSCTANTGGGGPNPTVIYTLGSATDSVCVDQANDSNTIDSNYSLFGMTGWVLADKAGDESGGNDAIVFTDPPTSGETSPGSWAISPNAFSIGSSVALVLKQANSFAAFLLDSTSGTWTTAGPGGSTMDLSHASIYYQPTVIPLPAAAWLLFGGLGGLAFIARRRKGDAA